FASVPLIEVVRSTSTGSPSTFFISAAIAEPPMGFIEASVAYISGRAASIGTSFVAQISCVMVMPIGEDIESVKRVAFQSLTFFVSVVGVSVTFICIWSSIGAYSAGTYFFMSRGRSIVL